MDNKEIFMRVLLSDKVKLEPKNITKNFRTEITNRLKGKLEGRCTRHGFVKKGSIEVYKITPGVIEMISLNGALLYEIYFHADICNPMLGTVVKAKITNINKFGILAESGYNDPETNEFHNILEIIIAKNSVSILSDMNLEDLKIGDEVSVEIMGKKYELNDKHISVVGRIVTNKVPTNSGGGLKSGALGADEENEEDEEYQDEEEKDEEEEEEEDGDGEEEEGDGEEEEEYELEEDEEVKSKVGGDLFSDDDGFFDDEGDEYNIYSDDEANEDEDEADV